MLLAKPGSLMSIDECLAPVDVNELSCRLREAKANGSCAIVTASSMTGRQSSTKGQLLDLGKLDSIIEHRPEDQVICVESGIELAKLDALLAKHNQWLPLSLAKGTKLIDVIETGDGGCLEHGFGGPRDLVLGMDVVLSSGSVIKTGGKVVKNVTGYDLTKLFIGSRGTLGIVASANLRLFARPDVWRFLAVQADSASALIELSQRVIASGLPVSAMELIDGQYANAESIPQHLSNVVSHEHRFALILAISGHAEVVNEIAEQVVSLVGPYLEITCREEKGTVLEAIDSIASQSGLRTTDGETTIESALSLRALVYGMKTWWQTVGGPPVHIRPGTGRIRMRVPTADVPEVIARMTASMPQESSLALALSDQTCQYRVIRHPTSDSLNSIEKTLKIHFDASNMLNPHITL